MCEIGPDTVDKAIRYTVYKEIKTRLSYTWNRGFEKAKILDWKNKLLELKNTFTKIKNSIGFSSRIDTTEDSISELEDKSEEISYNGVANFFCKGQISVC